MRCSKRLGTEALRFLQRADRALRGASTESLAAKFRRERRHLVGIFAWPFVGSVLPLWVFTPQRFGLAGSVALNGAVVAVLAFSALAWARKRRQAAQ